MNVAMATTSADIVSGQIGRIPVRNLWLLMLYASQLFRQANRGKTAIEDNPDWQIAPAPGPETIRMQCAVVDLGKSHVTMGAVSTYIPQVGLITSVATMASDKPAFVGEMGIEFKLTDSSTGKIMAAGMDKRYGGKKMGKGTDSWADVFNIMDYYVKLMGFRLCRLQENDNCERP